MHIHIHIYIHTYILTYTTTYAYTHTYTHTHTDTYTQTHAHTCTCTHIYIKHIHIPFSEGILVNTPSLLTRANGADILARAARALSARA